VANLASAGSNTGEAAGDTCSAVENLAGSSFADTLTESASANALTGSDGADTLTVGAGADTLTGGQGADNFEFNLSNEGVDTTIDFAVAAYEIHLNNTSFAVGADGTLASTRFAMGAAATTSTVRIIYNSSTGGLLYDADGNGAGAAVQIAPLSIGLALTNADFLVI
jgi:serralysin